MTHRRTLLVFGATNLDEIARVSRHPQPGETVVAHSIGFSQGGKGANQAYAAAVAGGQGVSVYLTGAVGDDAAGQDAIASLSAAGVDTTMLARVVEVPTGRAYITVSDDGENSIVVALGANAHVSPASLDALRVDGASVRPDVVVAQTEIGAASINAVSELAEQLGARLIINNGPVVGLSAAALAYADPLVVNEHEAADMLDNAHPGLSAEDLAGELRRRYSSRSVIITLGGEGSVVSDPAGVRRHAAIPAPAVVDTTGAGDTFVGALAAAIAVENDIDAAIDAAALAASNSVSWKGARAPLH